MTIESLAGTNDKTFEVRLKLRVFDEGALELAFEDLENAGVLTDGLSYKDNTIEENLSLLVKNLDMIAVFREAENVCFVDMGFEEVE